MSGIKSIQMKNNILNEKLAEYRISLLQITYIVKGKQCSPLFIRKSPVCAITSFLQGNLEEIMQWAILSDLRTLTKKQSAGL